MVSYLTDVAYTVIDGSTHAISIAQYADRVSIINVSDPSNPDLVANVSDTANYALDTPSDIATITLGSSTYALVTSYGDNGVQIINITDPRNPIPASTIFDDMDNYAELAGAKSITTVTIGLSSFALVAASNDDGVQIINITDPYNPTPTSAITDGVGGYEELDGARSITATTIGTSTYALVAAAYDDGVQIIDITDPRNPIPASAIFDGMGDYTKIAGAKSITTTTIDKSTYALVVISNYNGVQIINITNPLLHQTLLMVWVATKYAIHDPLPPQQLTNQRMP